MPRTKCRQVPREFVEKNPVKKCGKRSSIKKRSNEKSLDGLKEKKNCRKVGVGQPRRIPRISPTLVCNVG